FHPLRRDLLVALGERAQAADRIARKALRRGGLAHRAEPEAIRGAPGGAEGGALRAAIGRLDRPALGAGENPDLPEGPEARIGSCLRRVRFLPSIRPTSPFTPPRSPPGRRLWPDGDPAPLVRGPETVFDLTRDIRTANREHFVGFYLNSRNQVLRREIISIGSLNASIVHPREVYQPAIAVSAASLILAH